MRSREMTFTLRLTDRPIVAGEATVVVEEVEHPGGAVLRQTTARWCADLGAPGMRAGVLAALDSLMFPQEDTNHVP